MIRVSLYIFERVSPVNMLLSPSESMPVYRNPYFLIDRLNITFAYSTFIMCISYNNNIIDHINDYLHSSRIALVVDVTRVFMLFIPNRKDFTIHYLLVTCTYLDNEIIIYIYQDSCKILYSKYSNKIIQLYKHILYIHINIIHIHIFKFELYLYMTNIAVKRHNMVIKGTSTVNVDHGTKSK